MASVKPVDEVLTCGELLHSPVIKAQGEPLVQAPEGLDDLHLILLRLIKNLLN